MNSESTYTSQFWAQEFVKRLMSEHGQLLRFLMLVVVDTTVDGFKRRDDTEHRGNRINARAGDLFLKRPEIQVVERVHT